MLEGLIGYIQKVVGMGYRSSAMSSLLWLNALVSAPCFLASFCIKDNFRWAPFCFGAFVVIFTIRKYEYLVKLNPRWVQSERYQLESQKLDIVAQKGGPIIFDTLDLPLAKETDLIADDQQGQIEQGNS